MIWCIMYNVYISAVNCGDPLPPSDGYLEPYSSTVEGAKVNRIHVCQDGQLAVEESICSSHGQWKVFNGSNCTSISISSKKNYIHESKLCIGFDQLC